MLVGGWEYGWVSEWMGVLVGASMGGWECGWVSEWVNGSLGG